MSRCTCSSPSSWEYGPCDYCTSDYCEQCEGTYSDCDCDYCEACEEKTDHTLEDHLFDAQSLFCFSNWGCELDVEHYHMSDGSVKPVESSSPQI